MYKRLFEVEKFNKNQINWKNHVIIEPSEGTNQELSYIDCKRDIKLFNTQFLNFEIMYRKRYNNYIRYLLSGGLNIIALTPSNFAPIIKLIEFLLKPFNHIFCLHHMLIIKKRRFE
jgi:hypothetical protein